ncbi:transketolase family protein [Thermanaerosceptrum fracticalcis]|uniref:Transketolase family protein n=1 Tax=Thermanaerosceptrum fracticalcis TaxID=1712410 RepID=A0A7G6E2J0_THEFR|nr:transketolase family protein [Thermanaerosceptrum fracticalcis]QNB46294.1 transketolase family protein [Thermanaerosceptrum fracticalcis]
MKMKPTRDGYGEGLLELGRTNPDVVVLDADLAKSTRTEWFMKQYPDRFFDMGIAEQDMLGTAGGLALGGKIPFVTTYGVFVAGRAWDQIRTTVAYAGLNVKIGGAHGGISVGPDGATHQALEEIALMRVLPGMTLIIPADAVEAKKATIAAAGINGPCYLRFAREATPVFTREEDPFVIGKANTLREGSDVTIIACGPILYEALLAGERLQEKGIEARVINMHTVKPLDEEAILKAASETGAIVTAEEHQIIGGLGGAVAEVLVKHKPVPVEMVGINDTFGESGTPEELAEKYGLTARDIMQAAERVLGRKK